MPVENKMGNILDVGMLLQQLDSWPSPGRAHAASPMNQGHGLHDLPGASLVLIDNPGMVPTLGLLRAGVVHHHPQGNPDAIGTDATGLE